MPASRTALLIVAALVAGCAKQVGGDLEGEGGEGGGRAFDTGDGAGGADLSSSAAGDTATSAGPATTSATSGPASSAAATTATSGPSGSTSVAATSVAATSGSGNPSACDGTADCNTCAVCAENGVCAAPLDDCLNDSDCSALLQCLQPCTTQTCADQCFIQYQQAAPMYDQLYGCVVCDQCPGDCDGPSSGC